MKVNVYAAGVVGFAGLMLLLVTAMFIGPRADLEHQDDLGKFTASLEQLASNIEGHNRRLRDKAVAWDCRSARRAAANQRRFEGTVWTWTGNAYGRLAAGVDDSETDFPPEPIDQRLSEAGQLLDEGWQVIDQKLASCIDQTRPPG